MVSELRGSLAVSTRTSRLAPKASWQDALVVIRVVEYCEQWPAQFEMVADALWRALDGVPVRSIEHVGSTAVRGATGGACALWPY